MRILVFLGTLLVFPVTAHAWPPGDTTGITLQFQNLTRSYNVHVPASYDGSVPVPLVLDFHGYTNDPSTQEGLSGFSTLSETVGFIVAYPEGYEGSGSARSWNAGICCPPATTDGIDDVGFAKALVADIEAKANIDPLRVYATGLSNGGGMSQRLACDAADVFAAASPVACPLLLQPFTLCQPARPISVLHFAGLSDQVVPYNGGPVGILTQLNLIVPSSPDSFAYWVGTDGCGSGPPEVVENFGDGASCDTHTACAAGVEVGLCSLYGTVFYGHVLYSNSENVNIAQRAWTFMSQFTLPAGFTTTTSTTTSTTTTTTTLPSLTDQPINGTKLTLARAASGKQSAVFVSKSAATLFPAPGSANDPRTAGATVDLLSANAQEGMASFALPAGHWSLNKAGTTYKFLDKTAPDMTSAVKTAVIRAGKVVKVVSKAAGLPLAATEGAVGVRVRTGQLQSCARFGGTIVKDETGKFLAKNAAATLSDCSDASLRGSPSGAFVE
jgi:polyhydroxybutyrate depolymerase